MMRSEAQSIGFLLGCVGRTENHDRNALTLPGIAYVLQNLASGPLGQIQIENYQFRTIQGPGVQVIDKLDGTGPVGDNQEISLDVVLRQSLAHQAYIGAVVLNQKN